MYGLHPSSRSLVAGISAVIALPFIAMSLLVTSTLGADPVRQWLLDETSGTTAADSTANEEHGTYIGGVTLGQASPLPSIPNAASFDGGDDFVNLHTTTIDFSQGFTIALWARPTATCDFARFIELGNGANSGNIIFTRFQSSQTLSFYVLGGTQGTGVISADNAIELNEWQHFAVTVNSSGLAKLYKNGVLLESLTTGLPTNVSRSNCFLGKSNWSQDDFYKGSMADVRIYTSALTVEQIAGLCGLVGFWKFDEGTGNIAADAIDENDANISGATWTTDCNGTSALSFDGVGGTAATASTFSPPDRGTVAFWMRSAGVPGTTQRLFGISGNWEARQITDGAIRFDLGGSPSIGYAPFSISALKDEGRWYHVVAMYDISDDSYAVYVNGVLESSGTATTLQHQNPGILSFGTRTGSSEYWEGALRDFRVYERWITGAEIAQLAGIIAYWKLDETSGTVAVDASAAGNDASFVGSPTLGVSGYNPSQTNTGIELDGASQSISSGASLLNDLEQFTLAAWFRPDSATTYHSLVGQHSLIELLVSGPENQVVLWNTEGAIFYSSLPDNKWSHLLATGNRYETRVYINGNHVSTGDNVPVGSYGSNQFLTKVGEGVADETGGYYDGRVDDIRIYSRAVCPIEAKAIYREGRGTGVRIIRWVEAE